MRYLVFEFEREADPGGDWISYGVRMKLDLVGCKISLDDWSQIPRRVRDELTELSAETDAEIGLFSGALASALAGVGVQAQVLPTAKRDGVADWRDPGVIGADAKALLDSVGARGVWPELDRFGRYVVCTFARKEDVDRARRALNELGYLAP